MENKPSSEPKVLYTKFSAQINNSLSDIDQTKVTKVLKHSFKMSKKYWGFVLIAAAGATLLVELSKPKKG